MHWRRLDLRLIARRLHWCRVFFLNVERMGEQIFSFVTRRLHRFLCLGFDRKTFFRLPVDVGELFLDGELFNNVFESTSEKDRRLGVENKCLLSKWISIVVECIFQKNFQRIVLFFLIYIWIYPCLSFWHHSCWRRVSDSMTVIRLCKSAIEENVSSRFRYLNEIFLECHDTNWLTIDQLYDIWLWYCTDDRNVWRLFCFIRYYIDVRLTS